MNKCKNCLQDKVNHCRISYCGKNYCSHKHDTVFEEDLEIAHLPSIKQMFENIWELKGTKSRPKDKLKAYLWFLDGYECATLNKMEKEE